MRHDSLHFVTEQNSFASLNISRVVNSGQLQCILMVHETFRETKCHLSFYRPQMKLRKGTVFTPVCQSFCSQRGGGVCLSACWDTHPWADSLPSACWDTHPPCPVHAGIHTPLPSACWDRHGYCCGRYASYWNAFLL